MERKIGKNKLFALMICLILGVSCLVATATACSKGENQKAWYTFEDSNGREVTLTHSPERVVSCMDSYSEAWALAGGQLVGSATSERELDILAGVPSVGTVKDINIEILLSLSPDFVILSSDIAGHKKVGDKLDEVHIPYAYFRVDEFADYLNMLEVLTDITGRADLYRQNGLDIESEIDEILAGVDKQKASQIKVLFVRARSKGVKAIADEHMVTSMIDEFGCVNVARQDQDMASGMELSMEKIIEVDPDIILVSTMGDPDKAKAYIEKTWESNPAWKSLKAVKNKKYVFLEKELFHYKPNNRWAQSYRELAKILFG